MRGGEKEKGEEGEGGGGTFVGLVKENFVNRDRCTRNTVRATCFVAAVDTVDKVFE